MKPPCLVSVKEEVESLSPPESVQEQFDEDHVDDDPNLLCEACGTRQTLGEVQCSRCLMYFEPQHLRKETLHSMALEYKDQEVPSTPQPGTVSMTFQGYEPMWNKSRRVSGMSQAIILHSAAQGRTSDSQEGREAVAHARQSRQADRNMPAEDMQDEYWLRQPHSELDLQFSDHWTGCWSNNKRDKHVYLAATHDGESRDQLER